MNTNALNPPRANTSKLTVVILTKNEEKHLTRAMASVSSVAHDIFVIDSGSSDRTVEIARDFGAHVLYHAWTNHAEQFNWALSQLPKETEWVLRLDADEVISDELVEEIKGNLILVPTGVNGISVLRRIHFMGRPIRWGGVCPTRTVRMLRHGCGRCENRWMDEHIVVDGRTMDFTTEIIDDNKNSLTWWTEKHNGYASREVVDILNLTHGFWVHETIADLRGGHRVGVKRWIKEKIYLRFPGGVRALIYFLYRYLFRLGFLDGPEGAAFHVLQGFWYRYLVDVKMREVQVYMKRNRVDAPTAIRDVLGIELGR